ncbi:MAG: hypothetical protein JWN22_911 [Nocardioides sp.]|jgi:hypothetical protein|nr:hypothetical protein [Nocardioides sp.]
MIDLEERFERAWAGEPAHVDLELRLAGGRTRLRRRRLAVAGGALAAAVALSGGAAVAIGVVAGHDPGHGPGPAGSPRDAGLPRPVDPDEPSGARGVEVAQTVLDLKRIDPVTNAAYTDDGRVVVRPGWLVTQKIDDVYVAPGKQAAIGLEITNTTTLEAEWYYLQWGEDGSSSVNRSWPQANPGMTLRGWMPGAPGSRSRP